MKLKTSIIPIYVPFLIGLGGYWNTTYLWILKITPWKTDKNIEKFQFFTSIDNPYIHPSNRVANYRFTRHEIIKMNYHFIHPSTGKQFNLIKRQFPKSAKWKYVNYGKTSHTTVKMLRMSWSTI